MTEIIITRIKDSFISACMVQGKPAEFQCVSVNGECQIGNIYLGMVKNIVKNIKGAFVEFEKGQIGFLPIRNRELKVGDEVLVQIKREATKEKKPMLSDQIELTGKYLVLTSDKAAVGISNKIREKQTRENLRSIAEPLITEKYGFILRTSAVHAEKEAVQEEARELSERFYQIIEKKQYRCAGQLLDSNQKFTDPLLFGYGPDQVSKVIIDQPEMEDALRDKGFEVELCSHRAGDIERRYRIRHYLREALSRKVYMKSGGFLYVEQTEAMAVIDVNTGKSIGKGKKEEHIRKINREAAKEAARQIRLRNLSGIIMIDFIDMKSENDRRELLCEMQKYLNQDSQKAVAVDVTRLGLMEITRKKQRNPIFRQINIDILEEC